MNTTDEHMKMLNLSREWLTSLLPHLLSKINRVHYGVQSDEDLAVAARDARPMARSRKLLAVPFVGKDTPSRSNEFSHPDVRIGFTILSFMYTGLRRSDMDVLLSNLRLKVRAVLLESGSQIWDYPGSIQDSFRLEFHPPIRILDQPKPRTNPGLILDSSEPDFGKLCTTRVPSRLDGTLIAGSLRCDRQ